MKKNNRLDKIFGPLANNGLILFTLSLFVFLFLIIANGFNVKNDFEISDIMLSLIVFVFLSLAGAFIGFSTGYTKIDYANKKIKYGTKLFGVIFIGKWTYLTSDMKLGLKKTTERWAAYGRSTNSVSFDNVKIKIYLYDSEGYEIIPVKKIKKAKHAEVELEKMSKLLELGTI